MNCPKCGRKSDRIKNSLPKKKGYSRYSCVPCNFKFTHKYEKNITYSSCGKFYYTGEKCKNGHDAYRYIKGSACVDCKRERAKRVSMKKPRKISKIIINDMFYFSGNICKNNHISVRYIKNGHCAQCQKNRMIDQRKNNDKRMDQKNKELVQAN